MRSSLLWSVRRISLMSYGEILFRFQMELRTRFEKRMYKDRKTLRSLVDISGEEFRRLQWYIDLSDRHAIAASLMEDYGWSDALARQYLQHEFTFFAFSRKSFGDRIRWNHEYLNNVDTPLEFGPTLDYRDVRRFGDIKYAWEPNRHHHLVELAKAAYLTGDRVFEDEIVRQLDDWFLDCPYPLGVNWASSLECAIRVINWCVTLNFLIASNSGFTVRRHDTLRRWTASVHEHLRYIRRHFSLYSSANNHLIGEASGLFIGALCFAFPESREWLSTSHRILEEETIKQNFPDGVNKEQAVGYQAFVFDFLRLPALLGSRNGVTFSWGYMNRLERMAEFVHAIMDQGGDVPKIGDEDDGIVVRFSQEQDFNQYRSLLATATSLFDRGDFRERSGKFDEKSFWLLGPSGRESYEKAEEIHPERLSFLDGGYHLMRFDDSQLVFDCGPLGYLSLAAHGHADALNILLDYKGKPFLVDPGTYAYHTKRQWREYFRGTAAHNTVRIDREDQSVIGGNFMWLQKAEATLVEWRTGRIVGRHTGYTRLKHPAVHERVVEYREADRTYVITDRIISWGRHTIELFFHLDPHCDCTASEGAYRITQDGTSITLLPDPRYAERTLLRGSAEPLGGWFSPAFDRIVPAVTVRCALESQGPIDLVTTIHLH